MLRDDTDRDYRNVFGITFQEAAAKLQEIKYRILDKEKKGFASAEECAMFAREVHLDTVIYSQSVSGYKFADEVGHVLTKSAWDDKFGNVLFFTEEVEVKGEKRLVQTKWNPKGFSFFNRAKCLGEVSDGLDAALFSRNYFIPHGAYDEVTGTYNVAKPFTIFAKNTGADTSHIHEVLRNIAGENYRYILAWLRYKMIHPMSKSGVMPVFTGAAQGTGKSTFGECICRAMYGIENVIVSYQYDSQARFNADQSDALMVAIEEKRQGDNRNTSADLKSSVTARKVRKELKGQDPYYQDSFTEIIMSTNELVPMKVESRERQRRLMVMEANPNFTRERSRKANEYFTRLYGEDEYRRKVGPALEEQKEVIQQFKYELWTEKGFEGVNYNDFIETEAYRRCFNIPRTNEAKDIEDTVNALMPFVKASLLAKEKVESVELLDEDGEKQVAYITSVMNNPDAMQYVGPKKGLPQRVALCRVLAFTNSDGKPLAHSVVEKTLLDMREHLRKTFGIVLMEGTKHPSGGFKGLLTKARYSAAAWFELDEDTEEDAVIEEPVVELPVTETVRELPVVNTTRELPKPVLESRVGRRERFSMKEGYAPIPDANGAFETLNELKPGWDRRCSANAQYLDTFLLEADDTTQAIKSTEKHRLEQLKALGLTTVNAEEFYAERLAVQDMEAERLFREGIACRVVYSGSKSLHILVRVADSPKTLDEREWLDAYLKANLSDRLYFDMTTRDPSRLTRAPCSIQRVALIEETCPVRTVGMQRLLVEDWSNVYNLQWRPMYEQWLNRPPDAYEHKGKFLPSKPIYLEAVKAIMEEKFFTDRRWTGLRETVFFPAYRLLRHSGFSHDRLWEELRKQIDDYEKVSERASWKRKAVGRLIKQIDGDFEHGT